MAYKKQKQFVNRISPLLYVRKPLCPLSLLPVTPLPSDGSPWEVSWGPEALGGAPEPALTVTACRQTPWELASSRATPSPVVPALCWQGATVRAGASLLPPWSPPSGLPADVCPVPGGDTCLPQHHCSDSFRWQSTFYPGTAPWRWWGGCGQPGLRPMRAQLWGGRHLEHALDLCEPWPSHVKSGEKNTTRAVRVENTRGGPSRHGAGPGTA